MKKILILSVNPKNTKLNKEVKEIQSALEHSRSREKLQLISEVTVRIDDLRHALLVNSPQVVHFSGHGAGSDGIVLENISGEAQLVSNELLSKLFKLFKDKVECVLLDGCYSETQAETIHRYIDCVIGMEHAITDKAAINFSRAFYGALGAGRSYAESFEFGCNNIDLHGIPESFLPKIKIRNIEREINIEYGNYNEHIQGDYIQGDYINAFARLQSSYINIPSRNAYTFWRKAYTFWRKKGTFAIAFACGGAFLGSLTGYTFISIFGALIGGFYGFVFDESSNLDSNNNFLSNKVIFPKHLFKRGEQMIALASGGAFLGGIIAQVPGSIVGALAGAIFSLFTMDKII